MDVIQFAYPKVHVITVVRRALDSLHCGCRIAACIIVVTPWAWVVTEARITVIGEMVNTHVIGRVVSCCVRQTGLSISDQHGN